MNARLKSDWIFRIQILSFLQNSEVLNLLRFPTNPLLPKNVEVEASYWSRGCTVKKSSKNINNLINFLSDKQSNRISFSYNFIPYNIPGLDISVKKITNQLDISPTNLIWASTTGYQTHNYSDEAIRMTFESKAISLKHKEIYVYPTLLDCVIILKGSNNKDEMYQRLFNLLSCSIPHTLMNKTIIGCAELDEHSELISFLNILNRLTPWANAYSFLSERFDDLHPILIGPLNLCRNLSSIFDNVVQLENVSGIDTEQALGIVFIPQTILKNTNSRNIAQPYLVPKDKSNDCYHQLNPILGEFEVGRSRIKVFTARRWRELSERGMTPQLREDSKPFHVIQPEYCLKIGIDPDNMLIRVLQDEIARKIEQEINDCFGKLSIEIPLRMRVWLAHERGWSKWSFDCQEVLSFVKNYFF
ncbi:MAG: hypothetical protein RM049_33415 [Nostoc sp. DedQUE04]|uniref:hypothetical protein n=1 Tax=Nostoc sp. DedQUE04 TaxID=3075390 RepID=UPI002AD45378|nr:hypothetical protein [Nostoc sp. DedQUE04]MDZ8140136.1 hypothetical protein [Nostoc sp. DedQUE04]